MRNVLKGLAVVFASISLASPAAAQWTRVAAVPAVTLFSMRATGDTLVAGADTTIYVSTNAGASWAHSSKPAPGVGLIGGVLMRNGQLYAGATGQGVFVSGDLGASWQAFNQGLVGGAFDTQLDVSDLEARGDSLYAGTFGAGVYVRNLRAADTWHHYGEDFEPNQASNVNDLALGGVRLFASAGANGDAFTRDPGDGEWTHSFFGNGGLLPGVAAQMAIWTGDRWVVGTSGGVFSSADGNVGWTPSSSGPTSVEWTTFATSGSSVLAAFTFFTGAIFASSSDDGANWTPLDVLPGKFIYRLVQNHENLFAAQIDGLWVRSSPSASVHGATASRDLKFALVGPQPVRNSTRFSFQLPEAGDARIEVFDVLGRLAAPRLEDSWSAGVHEVPFDAHTLSPGVYTARITSGSRHAMVRIVHIP